MREPISTGAEWTFELIEKYHAEIENIAEEYGLDTYPNQIELITAEQMLDAYASVGTACRSVTATGRSANTSSRTSSSIAAGAWAWPMR
jgi:hypothetical protein